MAAGLVDTLKGEGPFTVFAPTDEAFAKLPKGKVESLFKPENKATPIALLTYHIVPGAVMVNDVVKLTEAKTAQEQSVKSSVNDVKAMVSGAQVIKTDISTSNGVILLDQFESQCLQVVSQGWWKYRLGFIYAKREKVLAGFAVAPSCSWRFRSNRGMPENKA